MSAATVAIPFLPRAEIEDRAAELRRRTDLDVIPVDPLRIADRLGVDVKVVDFEDRGIAGTIYKAPEGPWTIWISSRDPIKRQVFTVAHELGHFELHLKGEGEKVFVDRDATLYRMNEPAGSEHDRDDRFREIQANMFAAALLMPEADVRRFWGENTSVRFLARAFDVSEMAMRYRIEQLGLW